MSVSSAGRIIATAETSYEVLPERPSLPPPPDGYTWVSKEEYDYIHQQLVDSIRQWDESLSFQSWRKDRAADVGRDQLFEKIGDMAVKKGFGSNLSQIVGTAQSFLFGTRADVLRNKKLYGDRLFIIDTRWNLQQFRNGDYVEVDC